MKIIKVDNFDRDFATDVLIAESIHPSYVQTIVQSLNDRFGGTHSQEYFQSVSDDYKLIIFEYY